MIDGIHIDGPTAPVGAPAGDDLCCMGAAVYGPERCTCWVPVYDRDQAEPDTSTPPTTRTTCCYDCAYCNGSPERTTYDEEGELLDCAGDLRAAFWCHQGDRKVIEWRHPDGRVFPQEREHYAPPIVDGVPYRADGRAGERCAGWAAHRTRLTGAPA